MASPEAPNALFPSLAVAACAAFWGLYWWPLRAIEAMGAPGVWAVVAFNLPALLAAALVWAARPGWRGAPAGPVLAAGGLAGAGLGFYAMGLVETSVVRATLLFYLTPFWGTLFAIAMLGERPGGARWTALIMGLGGLALTLGLTPEDLDLTFGAGEALGLVSGVAWAGAAVIIRREERLPATPLVCVQFAATVAVAAVAALALGHPPPPAATLAGAATSWPALPSLVILASLFGIFWAMGRLSPGRSGLLMMTEVVVAVVSAALLLPEEALGPWEWLGAALIIGAGAFEVTFGGAAPRRG